MMSQHLYWVTKEVATIEGSRKVREKPHEERQLVGKKLINAAITIFGSSPLPKIIFKTGAIATIGIVFINIATG